MSLGSMLGWSALLLFLALLSAALVLPALRVLEKHAGMRRLRRPLRLAAVAAGAAALWFALPPLVAHVYRWL